MRESSVLTNDEAGADGCVLTGVPMAADYPSLNLGRAVMVYCYQLAGLMQRTTESVDIVGDRNYRRYARAFYACPCNDSGRRPMTWR